MDKNTLPFETLKQILRHVRDPERLDDHPWTRSLIVQEAVSSAPHLSQVSPGQQLIDAIACLFRQLQPANPPRCGKRLDSRWGEFGLLAALYFAPFNHGKPFPKSLTDAWRQIDPAILYFVYGKPAEALGADEINKYQLIGADLDYAAASTLSDWHRKGLQRLTETIVNRERFLSRSAAQPSVILNPGDVRVFGARGRSRAARLKRSICVATLLFLIVALGLGSLKARRIYLSGRLVYQDLTRLQELVKAPVEIQIPDMALPVLTSLQGDLSAFKQEVQPLFWLSSRLDWVPVYGNDLASASTLIELAEHLVNTSILSARAAQPLLNQFDSGGSELDPAGLTALLVEAQPVLAEARRELDQALAARNRIQVAGLSPRLQALLVDQADPVLKLADTGLSLGMALPGLLGAGTEGPKTYMLLPENEDELRPTGGFITSVGNLVLHKGEVISLNFESIDDDVQVDWSKPYPLAPWQLREYMNSRVLLLRDANWFTDFPTTVQWVEYLYAYTHSHSVDGVIAFDQHFLVMLLGELGPLEVEGAPYTITDQNILQYMRQAKIPPSEEAVAAGWYRKEFIGKIAEALIRELTAGESHDWRGIAGMVSRALAERHLLLQLDDPAFAALLAERGWDNAIRPGEGDFLMVADTNVGFNKTNAVVEVSLSYDVDLSHISAPRGTLVVTHKNGSQNDVPCIHSPSPDLSAERWYTINSCYWDYLRVYKQEGNELLDASPHNIPASWMVRRQSVPARVDRLDEKLPGVQAFGTLLVVPSGESLSTSFKFRIPGAVRASPVAPGQYIYHLKVQKQPGTLAIPIIIRIHLPNRASLKSISAAADRQDQHLLVETNLRTDVDLEVVFSLP